jgi:hypothetical protein
MLMRLPTKSKMLTSALVIVAACGVPRVSQSADRNVDYSTQIKPVLHERCFVCHGALKQRAGLRLDTVELMLKGGDSGPAITPRAASKSILLQRVSSTDVEERMPPEHEAQPLSPAQIALVRAWIDQGAPAPENETPESDPRDHWAFQAIVRPEVPNVANQQWVQNPVDAFLSHQHQNNGLTPQPEALSIVQLRRLYLDLIGIPPAAEEIAAFEGDLSPKAYRKTVDRLLDDPRHGERWARHWMDIWRYSDWSGLGDQLRNSQKHIWHWRDWIVESLNADTPYDEMVRLMLAADERHPNDLDKLRATGFLARNYILFNRNQWMDATVEHVSKGFLGLTMNCAKCHDHKYDPIRHVDYYRMRAFFEPYHARLDVVPGEADLARDGIPRAYDRLLDTPTYRFVRGSESNPDKSTPIAPGVPEILACKELKIEPISLPIEAWQPEHRDWVVDAHLATATRSVDAANATALRARQKLATAKEKSEAEQLAQNEKSGKEIATTVSPAPAQAAVAEATLELKVADMAAALANAERVSVQRRADAMQADRAAADQNDSALTKIKTEKTAAAVQAERHAQAAKAWHNVALAELDLYRAKSDKKKPAEEKLATARQALEKAHLRAQAIVKPEDQYTRLIGAEWTPTRFFHSTQDDPTVEFPQQSTGRRSALADWITDPRNPLTARVAANHIWTRHMGTSLVPTEFDFGRNQAQPTHRDLLDWLAAELIDSGWSMKHLHRVIVNSAAYQMSSSVAGGEANAAKDHDNHYLWRRTPIRLEAQIVRDSILALAGTLDLTMGGPSVLPAMQDTSKRRSLYFFHSDNERNLFLTTFDEALVKECYRRDQSIVPQQALALTNSQLVLDHANEIANQLSDGIADDADFIRKAFAVLLGINADDAELTASQQALDAWRQLPKPSKETEDTTDNPRAHLVWALLNHNDFVTLR